ncbi:hypothetical protein T09_6344 [Trichinella sp. T9]|nr:hypothetical protein T09_6344 [Trichinella sp. T9]
MTIAFDITSLWYCNVPPGAAAGSASTSAPVRPPLLLFADSSSLPRSLLRVAIIRARIVTATTLRARPLDNCPMVSAASLYRNIPPQGGAGVVAYYAAALIRCTDGPSVTGDDRTTL